MIISHETDGLRRQVEDCIASAYTKGYKRGQADFQSQHDKDLIQRFRDYQINWLTSHNDIEFEPQLEELVIRFLNDTADLFVKEDSECQNT